MTPRSLTISLHQPDDGDGLARFKIEAENGRFACSTLVWGYAETFAELAGAIKGFPTSPSASVEFQLGSAGVGQCSLSFVCLDGSGHSAVWVSVESEYPVRPTSQHQEASLCLRVEPSSVDSFHSELLALASGSSTMAELHGSEP